MAPAIVRMEAWGDPNRTQFEVKVDPTGIILRPADSGCQLDINLEVTPDGTKVAGPCLLAVQGTLRIADPTSQAGVEFPMQAIGPNFKTIRVPLSFADLAHVEARRADALEIMCSIAMSGLANIVVDQGLRTMAVHSNMAAPFSIGREQWLTMLARAGRGWTRLVELPMLAGTQAMQFASCNALLERATGEYRMHASESAIATCRLVVEGMVSVVADHWAVPRKPGQSMDGWLRELEGRLTTAWPDDAGAAEALVGLYSVLWSWTSQKHHYGSKVPLYQEASFVIGLTAELLTHAGHLITAHPDQVKPGAAAPATDGSATPATNI